MDRIGAGAELDARHVLEARELVPFGLQHDLAERLRGIETALGVHRDLHDRAFGRRRAADAAGRDLDVLLADCGDDVEGRERARRCLVRVDPHAHRVVADPEGERLADARQARELVTHAQVREVRQVQRVVGLVGRVEVHDQRQRGGSLDRRDAERPHRFGEAGYRLGNAILHLHRGEVDVRAALESDLELHLAVGARRRFHVDHVLDAVHRLLDRAGDGLGDGARVCARIGRPHLHGRRHHVRVLADRQARDRHESRDEDQRRQDRREDRPVDEDPREISVLGHATSPPPALPARASAGWAGPSARGAGSPAGPGRISCACR